MKPADRVIVALDVSTEVKALRLAESIAQAGVRAFKVGLELFHAGGPGVVRELVSQGWRVFLDLKYHDIPTTVRRTVAQASGLGIWMLNVHASGGAEMMRQAREAAVAGAAENRPLVIGVTVLTNLDSNMLRQELGLDVEVPALVDCLARLAHTSGLDGVVCSPLEVPLIKAACGPGFVTVTPGVRPPWSEPGDQRRITTPGQAVASGADYLVIGRPITRAPNPVEAARRVIAELEGSGLDGV